VNDSLNDTSSNAVRDGFHGKVTDRFGEKYVFGDPFWNNPTPVHLAPCRITEPTNDIERKAVETMKLFRGSEDVEGYFWKLLANDPKCKILSLRGMIRHLLNL
jgi:hypothetical protein